MPLGNSKTVSQLDSIGSAVLADNDLFTFVDVSDQTFSPSGTNKKITSSKLASEIIALADNLSAITGPTGPAGPTGPEGPEGPEGPVGPAGTAVVDGTTIISDAGTLGVGTIGSSNISAGAITASAIANNAVTTNAIINDGVTFDKLQNIATNRVLGRITSGSGNVEALELDIDLSSAITGHDSVPTSTAVQNYFNAYNSPFDSFGTYNDRSTSSFYRTSSFISKDGELYAAGYGAEYSIAGIGGSVIREYGPRMIPLADGEKITNIYSGGANGPSMYVLTDAGNVYSCGYNGYGQLGLGNTIDRTTFQKITFPANDPVVWFSPLSGTANSISCGAVTQSGKLYMWGYGGDGSLGLGNTTNYSTPTRVNIGAIADKIITKVFVHNNGNFTYVIDEDDKVYSCGSNAYGQLGLGNLTSRNTFALIADRLADDILLSHGAAASAYIIRSGEVWSCGYNGSGQLGLGNTTNQSTFQKINGITCAQLSLGGHNETNVVCRQSDGSVRTWGYNAYGALGIGSTTNANAPQTPSGFTGTASKVLTLDNYAFTAILRNDGIVWTTGYNGYGQCGRGDKTQKNSFGQIIMNKNVSFKDISLFGYDSGTALFAVDQNDDVWACGYAVQYMLGVNNVDASILRKIPIV